MNQRKPDRVGQVFAALGKSVCYVGLFLGMQLAVMMPMMVSIIREELTGELIADEDAVMALLTTDAIIYSLISGLLTLTVVLAFYLIRRKKLSEALWLRPVPAPTLFTGVSLVPALYLIVVTVLALLPESWTENYSDAASSIDTGTFLGVVAVAIVAPIVEEFIFRGLIMTRLSRVMSGWLAIVLSAAVFGLCHGELVWFCYAFMLGAVFAWIDLRASSIWPSILGHIAFNAIGQVLSFVPETEDGPETAVAMGVLLLAAIALPIVNRRGIAALFRPVPGEEPAAELWELPTEPGNYEYDPWDE